MTKQGEILDWYDIIEEPIREVVRILRNNGVNTTCSCGHDMTIQADVVVSGQLEEIHRTLFNYLADNNLPIEYDIIVHLEARSGKLWRCWVDISMNGEIATIPSVE